MALKPNRAVRKRQQKSTDKFIVSCKPEFKKSLKRRAVDLNTSLSALSVLAIKKGLKPAMRELKERQEEAE